MTVSSRRVWRASPPTLVLVWLFAACAGIAIPVLAYLIYVHEQTPWIPVLLTILTVLALVYAWRFGLHPKLIADDEIVRVVNPLKRHEFEWDDITVIAPGENGLVIGSEAQLAEAWCIQKSNSASRKGKLTRADQITEELFDLLETHVPPVADGQTGLRIRRARPDEARLLTRMERAASEVSLAHVFPADEYPYPTSDIARRWRRLLRDRFTLVHILELFDTPVGFVAFTADEILHLAVAPQHRRRGYGSALLEFASLEIFDRGARQARLWVLVENATARAFYRSHGWQETAERRDYAFPPFPREIQLVRPNPGAPRRSR